MSLVDGPRSSLVHDFSESLNERTTGHTCTDLCRVGCVREESSKKNVSCRSLSLSSGGSSLSS